MPSNISSGYSFSLTHRRTRNLDPGVITEYVYSFKTIKERYLLLAQLYNHDLFVIKYFPKPLADCKNRYNLITNRQGASARRIITTCVNILADLLERHPSASFGFIGSEKFNEEGHNTQRYRIYKSTARIYFSPLTFIHVDNIEHSSYLLLNKKCHTIDSITLIQKLFDRYYLNVPPFND